MAKKRKTKFSPEDIVAKNPRMSLGFVVLFFVLTFYYKFDFQGKLNTPQMGVLALIGLYAIYLILTGFIRKIEKRK